MTIKEAAELAEVDLVELYTESEAYFKAKMARKEYHKYKYNTLAQKRLYGDCLQETLMSLASKKGTLNRIMGGGQK